MKIVQITPGSGDNFYCENCLRDLHMVRAMRALGHDVMMVPLYLPLQAEQMESVADAPIFYGGVNVYLQQKASLFRKTPRWLDSVFDSPRLLSWVSKMAGMTSPKDLGETTLSMLKGENGRQDKELGRLVTWLGERAERPDLICLSNALLVGLARRIKEELDVPLACLLQDEDGFLDGLMSPYDEQAWSEVIERVKDIDGFVSVSKYYADVMEKRLQLSRDRVHVVHVGIATDDYAVQQKRPERPTIGFLSRMCEAKGLDTLVEAFIALKQTDGLQDARLRIAGGRLGDDAFIEKLKARLQSSGLLDDVDFLPEFGQEERLAFLRTLSVLSVPERDPVAYGLYVLEALASGVPVVQPDSGVFPELIEATGGGLLCKPNDASALAENIERILLDEDLSRDLSGRGRAGVVEHFDIAKTSKALIAVYERIVQSHPSRLK